MATPITFEQVRDFLCQHWRVSPERLTPGSRLLHDLGIDADDASELLSKLSERFSIDLSSFTFEQHFGSELDAGLRWVIRRIFGDGAVKKSSVTLQDLVDAANRGVWIEHEKCVI